MLDKKTSKLKQLPLVWLNVALFALTFLRLLNADDSLSYDYRHYIYFLDEISRLTLGTFIASAADLFTDNYWADFKEFEFGFILMAYPMTLLFDSVTVYAIIASVSLLVKLEVLRFFEVDLYKVLIFFLFDISLFECNAVRASVALAIVMVFCMLAVKHASFALILLGGLLASFFHTSALALLFSSLVTYLFCKAQVRRVGVVLMFIIGLLMMRNLDAILEGAGGKLAYYLVLAREYDRYTGASGFNSISLLCIIFALFFARQALRDNPDSGVRKDVAEYYYFAMTLSITTGILIMFSGVVAVIGDRIWQLVLPLLMLYTSLCKKLSYPHNRGRAFFDLSSRADLYFFTNLIVNVLLFYYVVIGLFIRFPLSNFFSWILGVEELTPLEVF